MFQLPVNNLTRLRKARKRVKRLLSDIGLDYCKEHIEDYKEFGCAGFYMRHFYLDVCMWDPTWTKSQDYRTKQFCCSDCPFASKYFSAYKNHFRNVHRDNFENRMLLNCSYCMYSGNKQTLETHVRLFHMPYNIVRQGIASQLGPMVGGKDSIQFDKPMLIDRKELAVYYCKKCKYRDRLYNVVRRHIYREHFQHLTTPYVVKNSEKQDNSEETPIGSHGICCKSCHFVPISSEALVQHVVEVHEHIGYQITAMIGHTNVILAHSQASIIQRGAPITPGIPPHIVQPVNCFNMPKVMRVPVGNHVKQGVTGSSGKPLCITLPDKFLLSSTVSQSCIRKHLSSFVITSHGNSSISPSTKSAPLSSVHTAATTLSLQANNSSAKAVNTLQTQKWKICTICNELFPECAYAIHIKKHEAERVQAMAKYIMKIHNFASKCLFCNCYLPSDTLLNHMLIHGLTCPHCNSTFYEVEKMVMHRRQIHPNEPEDLPVESLKFDLMLQQVSPKNVQIIVTTYSMKKVPKSSFTTVQPPNSVGLRPTITAAKYPNSCSESLSHASQNVLHQDTEMGKILCPLCFTILKGPISDALAQHLHDQHRVLQALHPIEKKITYKCIHCLGVYTNNVTASTIMLHLVHCRGVGHAPKVHNNNSISALKRELVTSDTSDPKKKKIVQSRYYPTIFVKKTAEPVLILDPRGHADESYDARKAFLTAYFNRQPYPSHQEAEKLAASLWLWKSDVLSHFASRRQSCEQDFVIRKPLVLLGFNMQAVNQLKHEINFDREWLFTVNDKKSEISRTAKKRQKDFFYFSTKCTSTHMKRTLNPVQCTQSSCAFKPSPEHSVPLATDFHNKSGHKGVYMDNRTLKTIPIFPSVVETWTKETVQERFLYKRDGMVASMDFVKGASKSLDGCVSGSRTEEATWSGGMSPDESLYRPAERFEEKGKEMGLLGR